MPKREDEEMAELRMRKRAEAPYWWPETQTVQQLFLSAASVYLVWYIVTQLLSGEALKIDPSVRDLIVFIFGIIFGNYKDVYSFVFGSSASDKAKNTLIGKQVEAKDKIIAEGVAATAATAATALAAVVPVAPAIDPAVVTAAAEAAAPAAAAEAAPPAAEVAAPPAARDAVAEALGAAWWPKLTDDERAAITAAAPNDPQVMDFITAANVGKASVADLEHLVAANLLTAARANIILGQ